MDVVFGVVVFVASWSAGEEDEEDGGKETLRTEMLWKGC